MSRNSDREIHVNKPPRPHTEKWFAELAERAPHQVTLTRLVISRSGTAECCSLCGDTNNLNDYMGDEGMSARLCGDCKGLQERMYGAMWVPFAG